VRTSLVAALLGLAVTAQSAGADNSSGVDAALFRPSYDTSGTLSLEGARLPPKRDLSWKMWLSYASKPLDVAVPGIGDAGSDEVLDYLATLDFAFGFTLSQKVAIGLAVAVFRADTGPAYGERGRFRGERADPSTGLISLRPISNIDQSGGYEAAGLSGPLDVRLGGKYMFVETPKLALTGVATVSLPFGEDELFLGDHNLMYEPRLALDYRPDPLKASKIIINVGARLRERTVLQAYDPTVLGASDRKEDAAKVVLDIGSEALVGLGGVFEATPDITLSAEGVGFIPLPAAATYGRCTLADGTRCSTLLQSDYATDDKRGDLTVLASVAASYRINPHVAASIGGTSHLLGARGDAFRITAGLVWSPQPASEVRMGRGDTDGDGIPDVSDGCLDDAEDRDGYQDVDGCPDLDNDGDGVLDVDDGCPMEPEDRDGFQDDDGCPERDNDGDSLPDIVDRCPDDPEDLDGFEDDDGCSDQDNDGDGFADQSDKCPNDPETVNGVDDDDGCPDVRTQTGPVEAGDRIDLRGNKIEFSGAATLTPATKVILGQVAAIIRDKKVNVRVEVHVALGTKSKVARVIAAQKKKDRDVSGRRAQVVLEYLIGQGVPVAQVQAVGLGSERPLGANPPADPLNERVDFIKSQQRTP